MFEKPGALPRVWYPTDEVPLKRQRRRHRRRQRASGDLRRQIVPGRRRRGRLRYRQPLHPFGLVNADSATTAASSPDERRPRARATAFSSTPGKCTSTSPATMLTTRSGLGPRDARSEALATSPSPMMARSWRRACAYIWMANRQGAGTQRQPVSPVPQCRQALQSAVPRGCGRGGRRTASAA